MGERFGFNGTWNLDSIGLPQGTHAGVNVSHIKGKAKHQRTGNPD